MNLITGRHRYIGTNCFIIQFNSLTHAKPNFQPKLSRRTCYHDHNSAQKSVKEEFDHSLPEVTGTHRGREREEEEEKILVYVDCLSSLLIQIMHCDNACDN